MVAETITPTVENLKGIALFMEFNNDQLAKLLKKGVTQQIEAHTNVVIEGEMSWGVYIILEGLVGVFKTNKLTSSSYDVGQLRAGSFFGEMSLVDDNPRSATVKTLTHTQLLFISKENFNSFLDENQDLKLKFYTNCVKALVHRLRELDDNYVIMQYQLWHIAIKTGGGQL